MGATARFYVEPRLIHVLGMQYRSVEEAIKELVANSWDADASQVEIEIPDEAIITQPITIRDNGYGMTRQQVEHDYLRVGYDRRARTGERTPRGRVVRGHRGIGKFAGLMAAETMVVQSTARGTRTRLELSRTLMEQQYDDLERAEIPLQSEPATCADGTAIELHQMRSGLRLPSTAKLGTVLLREFGRRDDFQIMISGDLLTHDLIEAEAATVDLNVSGVGRITGKMWISENGSPLPDPGFLIRVDGRAIGAPTYFGLEDDPEIPKSLLHRVGGEVNADCLLEDVTAGYDAFIENSAGYQSLVAAGRELLRAALLGKRDEEAGSAQQTFVESYAEQIERLPLPKRERARQALIRVFTRLFDDPIEKKRVVAEVVLNAFETSEYFQIVQRLEESSKGDLVRLADILQQWGLSEVSAVVERARERLKAIEAFEDLITDRATLELSGVHQALLQNAWLLGDEYELLKSNRGLRRLIEEVFGSKYQGARSKDRPDLFLVAVQDRYLLVELKRPTHEISRQDVAQAETYKDEVLAAHPNADIRIAVIGGSKDPTIRADSYNSNRVLITTFREVGQRARSRLEWLIQNLEPEVAAGGSGETRHA